jgi:hypothetical protein
MRRQMRKTAGWTRGMLAGAILGAGLALSVFAVDMGVAFGETPSGRRLGVESTGGKAAMARPEPSALAQIGLAGMDAASDAEGQRVRGSNGGSWTSGLSFVAGMLFDPTTASSLRGSSANSSEASAGPYRFVPTRTESAQISGIQFSLEITQGGVPTFRGSLFGVANGFGVTRP